MTHIEYFKLQAKNLFRDYKTQTPYTDDGHTYYKYTPQYFDIGSIFFDFEEFDEENFSLMKAQHLLAIMLGFRKWSDLLNGSAAAQELAKLRWDNQDKIPLGEWDDQIAGVEHEHNMSFDRDDPESELAYFKHCLSCYEGYGSFYSNYLLNQNAKRALNNDKPQPVSIAKPSVQITSLPLSKADRAEFIKVANSVFESVMERIEPNNPELTRELWNAEGYVDTMLTQDMLPISRDYALSLIDAFLVHHVIGLATEADKQAA